MATCSIAPSFREFDPACHRGIELGPNGRRIRPRPFLLCARRIGLECGECFRTHHARISGEILQRRDGSRNQFLVGERPGVDDSLEGVLKYVKVIPVVESPLQFFEVAVEMLDAHLVKGADDGSLEQAPHALNAVGVNIADDPLFGRMAHSPMHGVFVRDAEVRPQFIGVNGLSLILNRALDESMEGMAAYVGDTLNPDLPAALDGPGYPGLTLLAPRSHIAPLSPDQCFIHFDDTEKRGAGEGVVSHGFSDPMAQIPSRLVAGSKKPLDLVGRDSLPGLAHEVDGGKPLAERQVGIVHDGAGGHAEMVSANPGSPTVHDL